VDSGSGYDAQNDLPVHVGLPAAGRVDIEVTFPKGGTRLTMKQSSVDPQAWKGKVLRVALK
jgi:hypothetical protein